MAGRKQGAADERHVHAYLSDGTTRTLRDYAREQVQSLSSIIDAALSFYFTRLAFLERLEAEQLIAKLTADAVEALAAERGV